MRNRQNLLMALLAFIMVANLLGLVGVIDISAQGTGLLAAANCFTLLAFIRCSRNERRNGGR